MKNNQKGFSVLILLLFIAILGITGLVYRQVNQAQRHQSSKGSDEASTTQEPTESIPIEQVYINPIDDSKTNILETEYYVIKAGDTDYIGHVYKINNDYLRMSPTVYMNELSPTLTTGDLHGPEPATYFHISKISSFKALSDTRLLEAVKTIGSTAADAYPSKDINSYLKSDQLQAFYFADGTKYFAKTTSLDGNFLASSKYVYAIRNNNPSNSLDISLARVEPEQYNMRTAAELTHWQNLQADGQVTKATVEYEKYQ